MPSPGKHMRGLSRDEIADLLVAIRPQSPGERELQGRAQEYVNARETARREDAARAPAVANMRRTYETVKTICELRRDALTTALPDLTHDPVLAGEVEEVIAAWSGELTLASRSADDQIEELKAARTDAWSYASRCDDLADKVVVALGEEHPASRELLEAKHLF